MTMIMVMSWREGGKRNRKAREKWVRTGDSCFLVIVVMIWSLFFSLMNSTMANESADRQTDTAYQPVQSISFPLTHRCKTTVKRTAETAAAAAASNKKKYDA